jgi:hypothetical protein
MCYFPLMGRLNREIEGEVANYFTLRKGFLINISDTNEADRVNSLTEAFCQKCQQKCTASPLTISLGEVRRELRGSGLSAVGPIGVNKLTECPLYQAFQPKQDTQTLPDQTPPRTG